jgi:uncharacterized membrane protein YjjB (DUF3815 family)
VIEKVLLIFFASLSVGVLLNMPRRTLLLSSVIGVLGYLVNFAVAILAELLARKLKVPSPVLSIPGIIPLVPGSVAYRATTYLVNGREITGAQTAIGASLTAVGIASGLLLASSLSRRVIKPLLARAEELQFMSEPVPQTPEEESPSEEA